MVCPNVWADHTISEDGMPYIPQESRKSIDPIVDQLHKLLSTRGEYNYAITRLMHNYVAENGKCYDTLNDSIGTLQCIQLELYRMVAAPYEDIKKEQNGDITLAE